MFRNLLIFGVLGVAAFGAGWFQIHRDGEHTTVRFDRGEIVEDTRAIWDRGREILHDRRERLDDRDRFADDRGYGDGGYGDRYAEDDYLNADFADDRYRDDYREPAFDDRFAFPDQGVPSEPVGYRTGR